MTTKRLFILLAVLLAGMSGVFLLPKQRSFQPVGVNLKLPEFVGEWIGTEMDVTQQERDVRGKCIIVAKRDLVSGRRVVLVDDRSHAPLEQCLERCACIQVARPRLQIVGRQENLRGAATSTAQRALPGTK